jgi:hypothetical protein
MHHQSLTYLFVYIPFVISLSLITHTHHVFSFAIIEENIALKDKHCAVLTEKERLKRSNATYTAEINQVGSVCVCEC